MAISVDPAQTTAEHIAKLGFTYTFLSDPEAKAIRSYDLEHPVGDGKVIARPGEFLIDPSGTVHWVDLTEDYKVRARPEAVLAAYDRLNARTR